MGSITFSSSHSRLGMVPGQGSGRFLPAPPPLARASQASIDAHGLQSGGKRPGAEGKLVGGAPNLLAPKSAREEGGRDRLRSADSQYSMAALRQRSRGSV